MAVKDAETNALKRLLGGHDRKLEPGRMVITGAAGSDKTVLAVELILGLLTDRGAGTPVPVRISAASLDTSRPAGSAVEDWLAEHLRQAYRVASAENLIRPGGS